MVRLELPAVLEVTNPQRLERLAHLEPHRTRPLIIDMKAGLIEQKHRDRIFAKQEAVVNMATVSSGLNR